MTENTIAPPETPHETPPVIAAKAPDPAAPNTAEAPAAPVDGARHQTMHSPRSALAVFTAIGFLLLFGATYYLWQQMAAFDQPIGVDPARVVALESQVRALQGRLSTLESRPAPAMAPAADLRPLEARIGALEQRPVPAAAPAEPSADLVARLGALETRLAASEAQAGRATARADRLARLQSAATALDAAQPLGAIADAPPALTRFATAKPPSEAALRLAYPDAARRAADASRPGTPDQTTGARIWQQVESLVTVRSGTKVLIGPPASYLLGHAHELLDAGDLAGAVAALKDLDPAAKAAMADWLGPAQALLDARAALATAVAAAAGRA